MHDLMIGLAYVGIFLLPIIAAAKNTPEIGKDNLKTEPKTLREPRILH